MKSLQDGCSRRKFELTWAWRDKVKKKEKMKKEARKKIEERERKEERE